MTATSTTLTFLLSFLLLSALVNARVGRQKKRNRRLQLSCPPGQEPINGACTVCRPGTISTTNDDSSCIPCPPGEVQSGFGQQQCVACEAGQFQNVEGQHSCFQCAPGFYQPQPGQTSCLPCEFPLTCSPITGDAQPPTSGTVDEDRGGSMTMDPHVQKWDGTWYDFNGECDLVFLSDAEMALDIHVRTTIRYTYSYISAAVLKLGNDTLQVNSWGGAILNDVFLEGSMLDDDANMGGYPLTYHRQGSKKHLYVVRMDDRHSITLSTFKDFVNVHVHLHNLQKSRGLMGDFATGKSLARDGTTVIHDPNEFGQEWQVLESEPKLFFTDRAPQAPLEACRLPTKTQRTAHAKDDGNAVLRQAAVKACKEHAHQNIEACVADILATGDLDLVESGDF